MSDSDLPAPVIEFPCPQYPIKVICDHCEGFAAVVAEVIQRHAPDFDPSTMTCRDSANGRFHSFQALITATGPLQLEAINNDLRATGHVHMVL